MSDQENIRTRDEFLAKIETLLSDRESLSQIENPTTERFLEAMTAWLLDAHDVDFGKTDTLDTHTATWQLFANAIEAALVYE